MADNLGVKRVNSTIYIPFTTHAASGAAVAPSTAFEAADVRLYKNGSATERSSQAGWTMTSPFDSLTGLHVLTIDLSDNTDAGFYAAGGQYFAVLSPDETVDARAVISVIAFFDIAPALADSVPADGALPNLEQAVYEIRQHIMEKSVSGTTVTVKKVDGSTTLETFTIDNATAPTSITRTT